MLSTILRVTLPGNARAIINWERVNQNVDARINLTKERFVRGVIYYSGMHQIFRYLLLNIEMDFLFEAAKNAMAYYQSELVPRANVLKKVFDTVSVSTENYGMLMDRQNSPNIPEIWVYTSRKNPLFLLPLDTMSWADWKSVEVAKIFNYDTPYLNVDFMKGTLTFPNEIAPSYGIVGVDIPCVWLKFASWWSCIGKKRYQHPLQPSDIDDFIHEEIMTHFYNDFKRIFTMNTMKLALQNNSENWQDAINGLKNDYRIALSGFEVGCGDLFHCIDLVKKRGMTVEDFISTSWLNNQSLRSLMVEYQNQWSIPDLRQYYWVTMIRDLDLVFIVTELLKLSPKYPIGERTKKELRYVIGTYERAIPWGHVHNPSLRSKLQNSFNHIQNNLQM